MQSRSPFLHPLVPSVALLLSACGGGGGAGPQDGSAVNHAPQVAAIADQGQSPDQEVTRIRPSIADADGDPLAITVASADPGVGTAEWDAGAGEVLLVARDRGRTTITLDVTDGVATTRATFDFVVDDVTRSFDLDALEDGSQAISIANRGPAEASFVLVHNGFRTFQSTDEIVAHVRDMPPEHAGEPFERRLWRFIRDNVYHDVFVDAAPWRMSPTTLVNSFGFGLCSSVAAAFAEIARAAGYPARIWALTGHVVPEVRVAGRWQMYDPDLAVYYRRGDGLVAGVDDLAATATLVASPVQPLLDPAGAAAYSDAVAGIYGSASDNFVWDSLIDLPAGLPGRVVLPPGAVLTYPGRFAPEVIARGDDGVPVSVQHHRQAAIDLPAGWTGTIPLPWVVWDVEGSGTLAIDGVHYSIGSEALVDRLRGPDGAVAALENVVAHTPLRLVLLVNPLRYELRQRNALEFTGLRVWQLDAAVGTLPPQHRTPGRFPDGARKPVA